MVLLNTNRISVVRPSGMRFFMCKSACQKLEKGLFCMSLVSDVGRFKGQVHDSSVSLWDKEFAMGEWISANELPSAKTRGVAGQTS